MAHVPFCEIRSSARLFEFCFVVEGGVEAGVETGVEAGVFLACVKGGAQADVEAGVDAFSVEGGVEAGVMSRKVCIALLVLLSGAPGPQVSSTSV